MGKFHIFHRKILIFHREPRASRSFQDPQEAAMSLGTEALGRWQDGGTVGRLLENPTL